MSIIQYKSVFAHELGHAFHRDEATSGFYTKRQEDRADRWAAELLINESDLKDACIWHNHHMSAVADELEVTHHILNTYLERYPRWTPSPL